jgi:hypothetical protein
MLDGLRAAEWGPKAQRRNSCDYSLMGIPNRLAKDGEKLVRCKFLTGAMELAPPADVKQYVESRPAVRRGFCGSLRGMFSVRERKAVSPFVSRRALDWWCRAFRKAYGGARPWGRTRRSFSPTSLLMPTPIGMRSASKNGTKVLCKSLANVSGFWCSILHRRLLVKPKWQSEVLTGRRLIHQLVI